MIVQKQFKCLIFIVMILFTVSCSSNNRKSGKEDIQRDASLIEVSIGGMTCTGCEQKIQTSIAKLEGIKSVKASFTVGNAIVEYYPNLVDTLKIKEAILATGYTVKKFNGVPVKAAGE